MTGWVFVLAVCYSLDFRGTEIMKVLWLIGLIVVNIISFAIGSGNNGIALLATFVFFPSAIALYFYPTICAMVGNGHPKATPIFALNLLAGWTFVGWIAAFIWALSTPEPSAPPAARAIPDVSSVDGIQSADTKECAYCAETIKAAAVKCRYCGSELVEA